MINLRNISSFSHPTPCCFKKKKTHTRATGTREKSLSSNRIPLSAILKRGNCTRAKSAPLVRSRPIHRGYPREIHHDIRCPRVLVRGKIQNLDGGTRVSVGCTSTTGTSSRRLAVHVVIIRSSNLQTYM